MPSYFIAIPLPDEAKDRLVAVRPPAVPGIQLIGREELHLPLYFLGEITTRDEEAIRKALATVRMNAFTITLKGIGEFPPEGQAQVLWAGVEVNAELLELHRSIGTVLADAIGFRPEERPYSPHITLARLNETAPSDVIERYLEGNNGFAVPSVPIDRFVLYSSNFADNGPHYREEAAFLLTLSRSSTIDLITTRSDGTFILCVVEQGPWANDSVKEELRRLQERLYDCVDVAVDGHLASKYPDSRGKAVVVRLDCYGISKAAVGPFFERFVKHVQQSTEIQNDLRNNGFISSLEFAFSCRELESEGERPGTRTSC
jgi:2'-5' RNA ligase